jgi:hypothetical protein
MTNSYLYGLLLIVASGLTPTLGQEKQADFFPADATELSNETYGEQLGTVHFPVSCNAAASRHVERGVALLHHMNASSDKTFSLYQPYGISR